MKENNHDPEEILIKKVSADATKKLKARKEGDVILFGLGTFGVIGWSVALPVLTGIALGRYLDAKFNQDFSWTLTLIFAGVIAGCINSWFWIKKKSTKEQEEKD